MIIIKKIDKVVSSKLKSKLGFNLLELIVILAAIAIIAAITVPRFFDFNDRANDKLLDAAISQISCFSDTLNKTQVDSRMLQCSNGTKKNLTTN